MKFKNTFFQFAALAAAGLAVNVLSGCCCAERCPKADVPRLVAHRGNSSVAPENTMAAFRSAWENDIWAIEVDVYPTADNVIICNHDGNLKRVSNGASDQSIMEMTLAEIRQFDVGSFKGEQYKGEVSPTLEEVFAEMPKDSKMFLEIKVWNDDYPFVLVDLLKKYDIPQENVSVISFHADALKLLNEKTPGFKTSYLMGIGSKKDNPDEVRITAEELIALLTNIGATGVDACGFEHVDAEYVKKIHDAGFEFHAYTIDDPETAKHLFSIGIDSVTTNVPVLIRDTMLP